MSESSQRSHKVLKDLRNDYESKMSELKNKIKSLQMELDMERNQMSAQEEMLHSLVHNISLEFVNANNKDNKPKGVKALRPPPAPPSYLDSKAA